MTGLLERMSELEASHLELRRALVIAAQRIRKSGRKDETLPLLLLSLRKARAAAKKNQTGRADIIYDGVD